MQEPLSSEDPLENIDLELKTDDLDSVVTEKTSVRGHVWNLANYIVGVGVLGLPYAAAKTGLLPCLFLLGFVGILVGYTLWLLCESSRLANVFSYEELGRVSYGNRLATFVKVFIIIDSLGPLAGYMLAMGDSVRLSMKPAESDTPSIWLDDRMLSFLQLIFIIYPLCFIKSLDKLSFTSFLSLLPLAYLMLLQGVTLAEAGVAVDVPMFKGDLFHALPIIIFAYSCHQVIPPISQDLRIRNPSSASIDIRNVVLFGLLLSGVAYVWVGILGFLQFGSAAEGNVMKNFASNVAVQILWLTTAVSIALSYPVILFPCRISLDKLLFPRRTYTYKRFVLENLGIVSFAWIVAVIFPSFATLIGVFGAVTSTTIGYILPPLFYIKICPDPFAKSRSKQLAVGIAVSMSVCGFISFISICASTW